MGKKLPGQRIRLQFTKAGDPHDYKAKFILKCLWIFISQALVNPHDHITTAAAIHLVDEEKREETFIEYEPGQTNKHMVDVQFREDSYIWVLTSLKLPTYHFYQVWILSNFSHQYFISIDYSFSSLNVFLSVLFYLCSYYKREDFPNFSKPYHYYKLCCFVYVDFVAYNFIEIIYQI